MIDNPRERLTDIGLDMGFATPSHFSQAFRRNFGFTPREFRSEEGPVPARSHTCRNAMPAN